MMLLSKLYTIRMSEDGMSIAKNQRLTEACLAFISQLQQ